MAKASLAQRISEAWYEGHGLLHLLRPASALFSHIAAKRRCRDSHKPASNSPIVVVVGNIAVGGTGKTPLIIALVKRLRAEGWQPGVISRGYGSQAPHYPYEVSSDSPVEHCGDEPLLIARQCDCPVVIDADRNQALAKLQARHNCDIVLSDDGLQHYRLARHIEFAVLDSARGLGNGWCLPAGPLREPPERLEEVDFLIVNQSPRSKRHPSFEQLPTNAPKPLAMSLEATGLRNLHTGEQRPCDEVQLQNIAREGDLQAIAGIGNPQRFFDSLLTYGLSFQSQAFDDHQNYDVQHLAFALNKPLLMTAKDGVKCQSLATRPGTEQWWQLEVDAKLDEEFWQHFLARLADLKAAD
ncbi:tetraacyldisaccharide 4'-kinase [Pseudoteredinibacter isoporae]|uniref:Tetraacyldisaccharide 4'-kinase n=1 Tax=Pseudoteredinibacter isoporae TaxID=570281 RepID=A0A7X0JTH3_9GAMM|nr:tetraacyldisaccharide 4'-kinase [Pseudoteredinibacter isoporae]MBB6521934.1 tetraacyldisaccharide 4'-kinase [Pseudoteredinibacter isoporae]NHO87471.1 tetraacyldisaccharide 4'-kinase [Pseudoteredinibacter isoporae]NIB24198.1 tetraacyldisaccharide 4'-kinase [Pseudoteredinibacter isoporae]